MLWRGSWKPSVSIDISISTCRYLRGGLVEFVKKAEAGKRWRREFCHPSSSDVPVLPKASWIGFKNSISLWKDGGNLKPEWCGTTSGSVCENCQQMTCPLVQGGRETIATIPGGEGWESPQLHLVGKAQTTSNSSEPQLQAAEQCLIPPAKPWVGKGFIWTWKISPELLEEDPWEVSP